MTIKYDIQITDELNLAIHAEAYLGKTTISNVVRKSFALYMALAEAHRNGKEIWITNQKTGEQESQVVGF